MNARAVSFQQVLFYLETKRLTGEQWDQVRDALRNSQRRRAAEKAAQFRRGDRVEFFHRGVIHRGRVTAINRISVAVKLNNGQEWRVGPSHLSKRAA